MESVLLIRELQKAKNKIKNIEYWWDGTGNDAGKECALSAVRTDKALACLKKTAKLMGYRSLPKLNDTMGHASVMVLYDLTIQFLQDGVIK